jgi:hypothetical protein
MPKRWRIELSLFEEDGEQPTDTRVHVEVYEDESEARAKFGDKDRAARNAGKGRPGDDAGDG